jgi:hypothetical protein
MMFNLKNIFFIRGPFLLFVPVLQNLGTGPVQCPTICDLCREANEDAWHVLLDCEESTNSWNVACLQPVITARLQQFQDVKDVIFDICSKETKEVAGRMAMLIWLMWNNRNQYGIMKGEMQLN